MSDTKIDGFYLKSTLLDIENWGQIGEPQKITKVGRFHGRSFSVYTKQIHHDNASWLIKRGLVAFLTTLFSLGLALLSKDVRSLWRQSLTGDETRRIKVIDDISPNDVTKKVSDCINKMAGILNYCNKKLIETFEQCRKLIDTGANFKTITIDISIGKETHKINSNLEQRDISDKFLTNMLTPIVEVIKKSYLEKAIITQNDYNFKMTCIFDGDNSPKFPTIPKIIVTGEILQDDPEFVVSPDPTIMFIKKEGV